MLADAVASHASNSHHASSPRRLKRPTTAALAGPRVSARLPQTIADYELLEELGRGGMGVV